MVPNSLGLNYLTRLRVGLSYLREYNFFHNFRDSLDPICNCGNAIESVMMMTMMMMMMMNCIFGMVDRRKAFTPYSQPEPLSEILTIANLRHAASRVWTCAEPQFRLCWMKLRRSNNLRQALSSKQYFSTAQISECYKAKIL